MKQKKESKKTLIDFFEDNDVRIGKDFQVNPPVYYQSLNEGMRNYFKTIEDEKQSIKLLILSDNWEREGIAFNFTDSDSTVFAILGLHRFFELLIKDILARVNPFLAVKFLESEKHVVEYLNNSLSAENIPTVEFSEAYKRLKALIIYAKDYPDNVNIQQILNFEFLVKDNVLEQLAKWRNRITHNGRILPNIYALDFLVTQQILPLVSLVLEIEKPNLNGYIPHYFNTPSGINILEQFLKIKFDYTVFYEIPKPSYMRFNLLKIAHLKELGRSAYTFDKLLLKNRSYIDSYYEDPLDKRKRFADAERIHKHFHDIKACPCCTITSLVIYKKPTFDRAFREKDYFFSQCISCGYLLPENMGEPMFYGLHNESLFNSDPVN